MAAPSRLAFLTLSAFVLTGFALPTDASEPGDNEAPTSVEPADILVVAPHPDDEVLMAAGVLARAKEEGRRVAVAIVTNGDLTCTRDGFRREHESTTGLSKIGVTDVYFLGYSDGTLDKLGVRPLPPVERRDREGRCVMGNTTYAGYGVGHEDVHSLFEGEPAVFTSESLTSDLTSLLDAIRPKDVYVSHPIDEHPDHAFAYTYLRRAIERASIDPPRVHRSIVHLGGCYPTAEGAPPCPDARFDPTKPEPPLPPDYAVYRASERLPVPDAMKVADPAKNPKYQAIASHASQTGPIGPSLSYLFSFARADEAFFPETFVEDDEGEGFGRAPASPSVAGAVTPMGPWIAKDDGFERAIDQRAPLDLRVEDIAGEATFEILASANGRYVVHVDDEDLELRRVGANGDELLLRRWPLPNAHEEDTHDVSVRVDDRPDDGGIAEISLRYDGEFLGLAVDPRPLLRGTSAVVRGVVPDQVDLRRR